MQKRAVIDSGPLIALFDKDDSHHTKVMEFFKGFSGKLYSTLPVVTEVSHMLDFNVSTQIDFLKWVAIGAIELAEMTEKDLVQVCTLTEKYSDIPMDFADASLILIAEKLQVQFCISLDSDFYIYRTLSNGYLENLLELQ